MHIPAQELLPWYRRKSKGGLLWLFRRNKSTTKSNNKSATSLGGEEFPSQGVRDSSHVSIVSSTTLQHQTSKTALKSMSEKDALVKTLASWNPPELFKAYPQAIKHARLRTPTAQVKAILQLYEERKMTSFEQDVEQNVPVDHVKNEGSRKKRKKAKGSKLSASEITSNHGWTEKVYVLATSGHLLEYAGDGAFDRLPEKFLPLGKESAAFASDAIAGEHWVLQVSRIVNDDGIIPDEGPRSIFRKLGFGNDMRCSTSAFLLIFDGPEDMNSWLVVLRKEIEALGGRKYCPDVAMRRTNDETSRQLRERQTRRYFIKRDHNRFETQIPDASFGDTTDKEHCAKAGDDKLLSITGRRPSMAIQKSMDSPSVSSATISSDQAILERLKETPRISYVSAATKTCSTSRGSSPEASPARAPFSPEDLIPKPVKDSTDAQQISRARFPTQEIPTSPLIVSQKHKMDVDRGPKSSIAFSGTHSTAYPTLSPSTSSFSVSSFSQRYSCVTNLTLKSSSTSGSYLNDCRPPPLRAGNEHHTSPKQSRPSIERKKWLSELVPQRSTPARSDTYNIPSPLHSRTKSDDNAPRLKSNDPVPRRFSSLDCARDLSRNLESAQSSFPHPPPTTALPALPRHQLLSLAPVNHIQDRINSSSNTENIRQKRRPVSLQAHSDPTTLNRYHQPKMKLQHPSEIDEYSLPTSITTNPKPRRAPPPPPLSLVTRPELRNWQRPSKATCSLPGQSSPEASSLANIPSFLNLEEGSLESMEGPWERSYTGSLQDMKIK